MMAARVAGVPIPVSFMLAFSSAFSSSLPAVSIEESRLLSVCNGLGLVCFSNSSIPESGKLSPSCMAGKVALSSPSSFSPNTARHPADLITDPLTVKSDPAHSSVTLVTSLTHFSEKASNIRPAISS